jgi:HSP20 family protein
MNIVPRRKESGFWLDPFRELEKIQRDMSSLLNLSLSDGQMADQALIETHFSPSIDYDETDQDVIVRADLPGVDRKAIEVTLQDGLLTIRGERRQEHKDKTDGARRVERFSGQFYRRIALPTAVDESKIKAEYKDGVLEITLPKKEEVKPKQIKVDVV